MRKKLLLLLTVGFLSFGAANAQYVTLTDTAFSSFLKGKYPTCFNAAGQLDTTCSAILNVRNMVLADTNMAPHTHVTDLNGLQYFKGLRGFGFNHLPVKILAKLPSKVNALGFEYNDSLSGFTNVPDSLTEFRAVYCNLTTVPVFPFPNSWYFCDYDVSHNKITSLPQLPKNLNMLRCAYNNLTTLPLDTTFYQMTFLDASHNQITSLPGGIPFANDIDLSYNQLTSLSSVAGAFNTLRLNNNLLTSINMSNWGSFYQTPSIWCQNNQINSITFSNNYGNTTFLDCSNNPLTSLPTLKYWLQELHIQNTQIGALSLPINSNPSELNHLETYNNNMTCLPNRYYGYLKIDSLQFPCVPVGGNTYSSASGLLMPNYPVCNPTYPQYNCEASPIIQGKVFCDLNSNGVKDAGEFYAQYKRVNLSDGTYSYTDHTGFYQLSASQLYTPLTLSPVVPALYKAVPADSTFNFWQSDTTVTWDIPLQPIVTKDSVNVVITTSSHYLSPGSQTDYYISWKNAGTTNLGPTDIVLHFNPNKLTYSYCSNAAAVQSGGQLTIHFPSLPAGSSGFDYAIFGGKTTLQYGDTALGDVVMTSGSVSSVDTAYQVIKASFDPNDKQATSSLSPQQVSNGGYIDYIIRFQNTGNDTAINVVIADTLSAKLKANTLELVSTSHNCNVIAHDNLLYFEMKNIMLPDSNVNESKSHGYVRFKIKPVSTLTLGDSVNNKASIYFDYNTPVVTNTAITNVKAQAFPLKLLSFKGNRLSQGNVYLYWQTANEENTKSFDVEQSLNGRSFEKIGEVKAYGNGNHSYTYTTDKAIVGNVYFRLKMKDKDGAFTYAPIVLIKAGDVKGSFVLGANPVNELLVINAINPSLIKTEATLINSAGVVVKRFVLNGASQTVAVSNLPAGSYYLRTQQGSERVVIVR